MKALCAGSFDPITIGHYDYIIRAAELYGSVVVAVTDNSEKKYMFTLEERLRFVKDAFKGKDNVSVVSHSGWCADLVKKHGADLIVKGIRNSQDFEYEKLIATVNREISGVETVFIPCRSEYSDVSSTAVREMIKYGKDYSAFVPLGVKIK